MICYLKKLNDKKKKIINIVFFIVEVIKIYLNGFELTTTNATENFIRNSDKEIHIGVINSLKNQFLIESITFYESFVPEWKIINLFPRLQLNYNFVMDKILEIKDPLHYVVPSNDIKDPYFTIDTINPLQIISHTNNNINSVKLTTVPLISPFYKECIVDINACKVGYSLGFWIFSTRVTSNKKYILQINGLLKISINGPPFKIEITLNQVVFKH